MRKILKLIAYALVIIMIVRMVVIIRDAETTSIFAGLGIYYKASPWLFWILLIVPVLLLAYLKVSEPVKKYDDYTGEKYTIEITCKAKTQAPEYYIWFRSKHYAKSIKLDALQAIKEIGEDWLNGLAHDISNKREHKDHWNLQAIKGDTFNPHYRLNAETYPPTWIPINDIEYVKYTIYDVYKNNFDKWCRKVVEYQKVEFKDGAITCSTLD